MFQAHCKRTEQARATTFGIASLLGEEEEPSWAILAVSEATVDRLGAALKPSCGPLGQDWGQHESLLGRSSMGEKAITIDDHHRDQRAWASWKHRGAFLGRLRSSSGRLEAVFDRLEAILGRGAGGGATTTGQKQFSASWTLWSAPHSGAVGDRSAPSL